MSCSPPSSLSAEAPSMVAWWWMLVIIYCLTGFTSLAYEVLWARMLSMQFGVSIFGVVLTVTAFMIGLGIGSLSGARWAKNISQPLRMFALLEMAIALYALIIPSISQVTSTWLDGAASSLTLLQWYLFEGAIALCLLVLPACAMGAGFALVLKAVERTPLSLGKIYGINTIGGAAGALLPLWTLPAFGWAVSVQMVAMLGLVVGAAAFFLSRVAAKNTSAPLLKNDNLSRAFLIALLIYAGIGGGSIMLEIGWIRLFGMIMLRTEYVLGVILAVFLLGIAFGSLLLPKAHKYWMSVAMPFVTGGGVLLSVWMLPAVSAWVERSQFQTLYGALWSQALLLFIITMPTTLALGAWLPLLADRFGESRINGAWLYGANCLGGALGAVVACLVGIPLLGSVATIVMAGLGMTALGLVLANVRWVWVAFAAMLLLAWPLRSMPPVHQLLPNAEADSRDLFLYEDAIALTHVVRQQDGQRILLSDLQRMDASTEPNAVEIQKDQSRLALLLHPDPHQVLFLGVGTGISMAGSAPFPELNRNAVELSQGAIESAKNWFAPINGNIVDNVKIQRDDAKHFLSISQQNYDVIIGDLFHPDMAGMGTLLSVQQFQRARMHLNSNGVFVQWLALNQFDVQSLSVILRSFRRVFPEAQMFMDGMHLALVGPKQNFLGAGAMLKNLERLSLKQQSLATGNEGVWTWLGRYWGPVPASEGAVQDEWTPYIEFNLPRARYDGTLDMASLLSWLLTFHPDTTGAMRILGVAEDHKSDFERAYVASELMMRGWIASVQNDAETAGRLTWLAYQANPQDRWIANALADNMQQSLPEASQHGLSEREALQRILKTYSNHAGAIRALWHLERSAGNVQEAERYRMQLLALSPLDEEAGSAMKTP